MLTQVFAIPYTLKPTDQWICLCNHVISDKYISQLSEVDIKAIWGHVLYWWNRRHLSFLCFMIIHMLKGFDFRRKAWLKGMSPANDDGLIKMTCIPTLEALNSSEFSLIRRHRDSIKDHYMLHIWIYAHPQWL